MIFEPDDIARLQRITKRGKDHLQAPERQDWARRCSSDLQEHVPWVWSERRQAWIQKTCMSAMVLTDAAGVEHRMVMASARGVIPKEVMPYLKAWGATVVPKDGERKHAEIRGVDYVEEIGGTLHAIGAGLDVCDPCDDRVRSKGIRPSTLTQRDRAANRGTIAGLTPGYRTPDQGPKKGPRK
ncbi:hypothetical protein [Fodinicola acaciae]|uniref:hypothetical protein n=1 Tax=Fodinicola acaciae TaxID=2681555 RepID=UPI0013D6D53C|nr:hypothetical protein [Fodinicola acaciae]